MVKEQNDVTTALLGCLLEQLARGVMVDRAALEFVESSCGVTDDQLAAALADEQWESRDMVLSLLFSPELSLRRAVEHILGREQNGVVNAAELAGRLAAERDSVTLVLADGRRLTDISLTVELAAILVDRLNLEQQLDGDLASLLRELFAEERMIAVRVAMRSRKTRIDAEARLFLETFFRHAETVGMMFDEVLDPVLEMIGAKPANKALDDYLLDKRSQLLTSLDDLLDFERKRKQYGMEYLLMHRYPVPYQSEETVRRELAMIERLITGILGLPLPARPYLFSDEPDGVDGEAELERLLRELP
ncbi:hypothetical protein [Desulfofustis limnaeus]|uniref:Uncharacterized protein n=1 Tax=Desulfofustis limnaeus TaxID=2740163 RepID=A0ABM7WCI3_9BACT|nr:hypothetical protein [Desulfofustis limnaeus]BDD88654.1 hypothetical protein DPPLL_30190 [Desulfofustis limnaeus]